MCTLTFFPSPDGYIFTHNRDEHFLREAAEPPQERDYKGLQILFPKDGRAGGTWIACRGDISVCLLNGAFEKHQHLPPYRLSRGIVLLDIFSFASLEVFAKNYDLLGIEPFTVVVARGNSSLEELRWDSTNVIYRTRVIEPSIWSSATLYPIDVQQKRELLFQKFLQNYPNASAEEVFHFHHTGKVGSNAEDLVMERPNGVKTLSISQIVLDGEKRSFRYDDMLHQQTYLVQQ